MCYETIRTDHRKEFDTLKEAQAFVERGKKEKDLQDFRIERVELVDLTADDHSNRKR